MATSNATPDTIQIQLTKGHVAIIDAIDADLAHVNWFAVSPVTPTLVYAARTGEVRPKVWRHLRLHRVIMERVLGRQLTRHELVDHIDGDTLNNRRGNLRLCSKATSALNKGAYKSNKLRLKGVYQRGTGKYRAQIQVGGKKIMLGQFETPEAAYEAYCAAAKHYHGEFARLE